MGRRLLIAGNWKMNLNLSESVEHAKAVESGVRSLTGVDVLISPSFISLAAVADAIKDSDLQLSAQNCFYEEDGAYTGEVSAKMIRSSGAGWVILGHSERRAILGESDDDVSKKLTRALNEGLKTIVCVGEDMTQREKGTQLDVVKNQVKASLDSVSAADVDNIAIAYEPVWAIGTGMTASAGQAEEMHLFIRGLLGETFGDESAKNILILYGGSVSLPNARELLECPDVDGALIGGASLDADTFIGIAKIAEELSKE